MSEKYKRIYMTRFFRYSAVNNNALHQNPKHKFANQHALNIYQQDANTTLLENKN